MSLLFESRALAFYDPAVDPSTTWLASRVPEVLRGSDAFGLQPWQWLGLPSAMVVAGALGWAGAAIATRLGRGVAARTRFDWDDDLMTTVRRPLALLAAILVFRALAVMLLLPPAAATAVDRCEAIVGCFAGAWLVIRIARVIGDAIERRARESARDGTDAARSARGVKTQVRVMRRVINFSVGIVSVALMLTQFEAVRSVGLSLLASAGIAGVVLGLAAQKTLAGLLAGIQISATQPVRIGDVVIVEGEWGTIEEITLTFVIVRIWDERRLVVPVTRFLDHPFENWTMASPELLGTVFLHVDWRLPVSALRGKLESIVRASPDWDGRVQNVQVTNAKEHSLEVRALVSAADASKLWDLRVRVREELVAWLQEHDGGRYLPRLRVEEDSS